MAGDGEGADPGADEGLAAERLAESRDTLPGALPPARPPPVLLLRPGDRIDAFELGERIGSGGTSLVYAARDLDLGQDVAIKILRPLVADARGVERFRREARTAASLSGKDRRFVTIYSFGALPSGEPYFAMERLRGATLRERLRAPLTAAEALPLFRELLAGLAVAHQAGVIHRDLKPENVFLTDDGALKILDLGLAKLVETPQTLPRTLRPGTESYMAPETWAGHPPSRAVDVWAVGVMLCEGLLGRHPFWRQGDLREANLLRIGERQYLRELAAGGVAAPVVTVIERALRREPAERYPDAGQMAGALAGAAARLRPWWRRWLPAV